MNDFTQNNIGTTTNDLEGDVIRVTRPDWMADAEWAQITRTTTQHLLELVDAAEATIPAPTCPEWCTMTAGHTWDSLDDDGSGGMICGHSRMVGSIKIDGKEVAWVDVSAEERYSPADGVSMEVPSVYVSAEHVTLDHLQAVRLADLIVEARDVLLEIQL